VGPKLFEEHALAALDDLYRFACRLEGDRDRAEDLLQQALLTGFRKFSQLKDPGAFRVWMMRIVRHTFLNLRQARKPVVSLEDAGQSLDPSDAAGPDAEERLLARRLGRELQEAMDALPPERRLAVFLVDVQGLSYGEAASVLEVPPGTLASRVARARAELRRCLIHLARERGWIHR
jgi:RNA polymerase sigma-70 factor (ECF subfamily)